MIIFSHCNDVMKIDNGFYNTALVNTAEFHNFAAPLGERRVIALLDDWKDTLKLIELSGLYYNLSFR